MTSFTRSALTDFDFGIALYAGATVTAYTVDNFGNKTAFLATLYEDLTSSATLSNPQTLDGFGKWAQPIYIDAPVILTVTGANGVPDHQTGVISANLAGDAAAQSAASAASSQASFGMADAIYARVRALYVKVRTQLLPQSLVALNMLRVKADGSAYELRSPSTVWQDILTGVSGRGIASARNDLGLGASGSNQGQSWIMDASGVPRLAGPLSGLKNRVINGDMRIDQRNVGAAYVAPAVSLYTLDRWQLAVAQPSKLSVQQTTTSPPAGFTHYLLAATASAFTAGAGDVFSIIQSIEGNYVADLDLGLATAVPVTVSFWAKSSLTGNFTCSLRNGSGTRSYLVPFSLPVANTWTFISATVPGDTTGTWSRDTNAGILIAFDYGTGSTFTSATTNAWQAGNFLRASGSTNIIGTLNATLSVTGVQVEKGSVATTFDARPLPLELLLCQRYYAKTFAQSLAPQDGGNFFGGAINVSIPVNATVALSMMWRYPVEMRATPGLISRNPRAGGAAGRITNATTDDSGAPSVGNTNATMAQLISNSAALVAGTYYVHCEAIAEL